MDIKFVFFGTPEPAVEVLEALKQAGLIPVLVVSNPDRPRGRGLALAPPPVKLWARANGVPCLQPEKLDAAFCLQLSTYDCQLFLIVAYGALLPKSVLSIPPRGAINVHYSLLPKYRGASPIEAHILADDRETGVSLLLVDEKLDHGPIVSQKKVAARNWPPTAEELRKALSRAAARLLIEALPLWVAGSIEPVPQDDAKATYTRKISAEDRFIDLSQDGYRNFLKIQALSAWGTYFLAKRRGQDVRVNIAKAEYENGAFKILRVVPEGKKEMDYRAFLRGAR